MLEMVSIMERLEETWKIGLMGLRVCDKCCGVEGIGCIDIADAWVVIRGICREDLRMQVVQSCLFLRAQNWCAGDLSTWILARWIPERYYSNRLFMKNLQIAIF